MGKMATPEDCTDSATHKKKHGYYIIWVLKGNGRLSYCKLR